MTVTANSDHRLFGCTRPEGLSREVRGDRLVGVALRKRGVAGGVAPRF
jgi:hypothetical protein